MVQLIMTGVGTKLVLMRVQTARGLTPVTIATLFSSFPILSIDGQAVLVNSAYLLIQAEISSSHFEKNANAGRRRATTNGPYYTNGALLRSSTDAMNHCTFDVTFKTVGSVPMLGTIYPASTVQTAAKVPVAVYFHSGGLVKTRMQHPNIKMC